MRYPQGISLVQGFLNWSKRPSRLGFPVTHAIPSQHHLSVVAVDGVAPVHLTGVTPLSRA